MFNVTIKVEQVFDTSYCLTIEKHTAFATKYLLIIFDRNNLKKKFAQICIMQYVQL